MSSPHGQIVTLFLRDMEGDDGPWRGSAWGVIFPAAMVVPVLLAGCERAAAVRSGLLDARERAGAAAAAQP